MQQVAAFAPAAQAHAARTPFCNAHGRELAQADAAAIARPAVAPADAKSGNAAVPLDNGHCHHWHYPTNKPIRSYQVAMAEAAMFDNTLICLPTGLGKTFIAATAMYNFYRCGAHAVLVFTQSCLGHSNSE